MVADVEQRHTFRRQLIFLHTSHAGVYDQIFSLVVPAHSRRTHNALYAACGFRFGLLGGKQGLFLYFVSIAIAEHADQGPENRAIRTCSRHVKGYPQPASLNDTNQCNLWHMQPKILLDPHREGDIA